MPSNQATKAAALLRSAPAGLTTKELCEALGVNQGAIGRIMGTVSRGAPLVAAYGRWRFLADNERGNAAPP